MQKDAITSVSDDQRRGFIIVAWTTGHPPVVSTGFDFVEIAENRVNHGQQQACLVPRM